MSVFAFVPTVFGVVSDASPVDNIPIPTGAEFVQYLPIFCMIVLGAIFAAGSFIGSRLLATSRMTRAKLAPYECGIVPGKEPPARFPVRFYLVALTFVVLDVEVIFLFPYAVSAHELGLFGLVEMILFAVPVVAVLAYLFSTGSLDWGPINKVRDAAPIRSAKSSIRRVKAPALAAASEEVVATTELEGAVH